MAQGQWDQETLAKVRQIAMELLERTKVDNAFREQIKQNPLETLVEAGLPKEAAGDFLRESQIIEDFDDVSAYSTICILTVVP